MKCYFKIFFKPLPCDNQFSMIKLGALIFIYCFTLSLFGKDLSDSIIKSSKKIVIFEGTFDPITNGHIRLASKIIEKDFADIVLIIPGDNPVHKRPLPLALRVKMAKIATDHLDRVYVVDSLFLNSFAHYNSKNLSKLIREISPTTLIGSVIGEEVAKSIPLFLQYKNYLKPDYMIVSQRSIVEDLKLNIFTKASNIKLITEATSSISSTKVREKLNFHRESYFQNFKLRSVDFKELLDDKVFDYIFKNGLYLTSEPDNTVGFKFRVFNPVSSKIKRLLGGMGLYGIARRLRVSNIRQRPNFLKIRQKEYKVLKNLGFGFNGSTYLINYNGQEAVVKIPHLGESYRKSFIANINSHRWVEKNTHINTPRLIDYSYEELWQITEYISGEVLSDRLRNFTLSDEIMSRMMNLYRQAIEQYNLSGIKLDLNLDNIIVRGDQFFLVDLGVLPKTAQIKTLASAQEKAWRERSTSLRNCNTLFQI